MFKKVIIMESESENALFWYKPRPKEGVRVTTFMWNEDDPSNVTFHEAKERDE